MASSVWRRLSTGSSASCSVPSTASCTALPTADGLPDDCRSTGWWPDPLARTVSWM